ncbi:MAG: hypothetical protein MJ123_05010 [Lachnospiraceae bacterium]|nr:hypothetical protein [Lachnospiraceae bacterium]
MNIKIELSLEEAVKIAYIEANKLFPNLRLTEVHSYDNDDDISNVAGNDGKRQWWYVNFGNELDNYVSILIYNGEVCVIEKFDSNSNNGLFDLEDLLITSEEAVKKSKEIGLIGGDPLEKNDWASGYNFKVEYASLIDNPEDKKIFFEVIGYSPKGNFTHIDFDATNGEIILAEEEVTTQSGSLEWIKYNYK